MRRALHHAGVDEVVEGVEHALAQAAVVVDADRDGDGLEARLVVALEDAGHQVAHRVLAQVGRHVGDADAVVLVALARPQRRVAHRVAARGEDLGALVVHGGGVGDRHHAQRLGRRLAGLDAGEYARHVGVEVRPVADVHALVADRADAVFELGVELQQPVEHRDRLERSLEFGQHDRAVGQRVQVVRVDRQRAVEALDRRHVLQLLAQQRAAVDQRLDVLGIDLERAVVAGQRSVAPAQALQHGGVGEEDRREVRVLVDAALHHRQRALAAEAVHQHHAQRVERDAVVGKVAQVELEHRLGLLQHALALQLDALQQQVAIHRRLLAGRGRGCRPVGLRHRGGDVGGLGDGRGGRDLGGRHAALLEMRSGQAAWSLRQAPGDPGKRPGRGALIGAEAPALERGRLMPLPSVVVFRAHSRCTARPRPSDHNSALDCSVSYSASTYCTRML